MVYKQSFVASEEIVKQVMVIEEEVYIPEYRGEFESMMARFKACPQMLTLVYDELMDNELIGYLGWLPISPELYAKISDDGEIHDDDIKVADLADVLNARHILLMSVAIKQSYWRYGIGSTLMSRFEEWIGGDGNPNGLVRHIVGCAVTDGGDGLCGYCGYKQVHNFWNTRGYNVYVKDIKPSVDSKDMQSPFSQFMAELTTQADPTGRVGVPI